MQELNLIEVDEVSGSGVAEVIGFTIGFLLGAGTRTRQAIDAQDNMMLSAMQYGA